MELCVFFPLVNMRCEGSPVLALPTSPNASGHDELLSEVHVECPGMFLRSANREAIAFAKHLPVLGPVEKDTPAGPAVYRTSSRPYINPQTRNPKPSAQKNLLPEALNPS